MQTPWRFLPVLCGILTGTAHPYLQVRCYVGDDEQRWYMWYSGRRADSPAAGGVDALAPSSGSVGECLRPRREEMERRDVERCRDR